MGSEVFKHCAFGAAVGMTGPVVASPILVPVTFDAPFAPPAGTVYSNATHAPGDVVFNENNIDVRVESFTLGGFTGFISATLGGFTDPLFPTTPATLNNIRLGFDLPGGGTADQVFFEYADLGGDENLVINGTVLELARFSDAPTLVAGTQVTVTSNPIAGGVSGVVTITGPVNSLEIGGQELGIDSVAFLFADGFSDYNNDGVFDQGDLDLVLLNWGDDASVTGVPPGWENQQPAGLIGQSELDTVLLNWGSSGETPVTRSTIPEPATGLALLLGGLLSAGRLEPVNH